MLISIHETHAQKASYFRMTTPEKRQSIFEMFKFLWTAKTLHLTGSNYFKSTFLFLITILSF